MISGQFFSFDFLNTSVGLRSRLFSATQVDHLPIDKQEAALIKESMTGMPIASGMELRLVRMMPTDDELAPYLVRPPMRPMHLADINAAFDINQDANV